MTDDYRLTIKLNLPDSFIVPKGYTKDDVIKGRIGHHVAKHVVEKYKPTVERQDEEHRTEYEMELFIFDKEELEAFILERSDPSL